jgi:hypothetical protein
MLALELLDQLTIVESEVRSAENRLVGSPAHGSALAPPAEAQQANDALVPSSRKSSDLPSGSHPRSADWGDEGQKASAGHQPTLRSGGYIFTASPTGNKAIAYDPVTREVKSVQLNATKEHQLKITPMTGDHVQLVALRIQGSKITRVAVFDLESDKWLPMDLDEPVKGDVRPVYVGHGGTAYDLGRNVYTYNAKAKKWDHLDIMTFGEDAGDESAAKAPVSRKSSK